MVRIGKYEAYITIDGRRLPEFDIEVDRAAKEAVCWIPSEAGKVQFITRTLSLFIYAIAVLEFRCGVREPRTFTSPVNPTKHEKMR